MAPPSPALHPHSSERTPSLLFVHPEEDVRLSLNWLAEHVGAIESVPSWTQLEQKASQAFPLIVVHQSMLELDVDSILSVMTHLRRYGSRLILAVHPLESNSKRLALKFGFKDWIRWSPETPFPLVQCINHSLEQAAMVTQIVSQDTLFQRIQWGAMDGLWDWNVASSEMNVSERFLALVGRSGHTSSYRPADWLRWLHPKDEPLFRAAIRAHMNSERPVFQRDIRVSVPNGEYRWLRVRGAIARNKFGRPIRMAGSVTNIQHQKDVLKKATYEALHDPVTQLANECAFMDRINAGLTRCKRHKHPFSVIHLDIDRFKLTNKALGHTLGDILLRQIARRIDTALDASHTLARLDGGTFGVLIEDMADLQDIVGIMDNIESKMKVPFQIGGMELFISLRIGFAMGPGPYDCARSLLIAAERVGDSASTMPIGHQKPTPKDSQIQALELVALETDLRKAIQNEDFEMYYQPIISLGGEPIEAYEALIRWKHTTRGWVSPGQFIPLAEDTGLILPLGQWVLETSFRQAWTWQQEQPHNPPRININVSAVQLQQTDLKKTIAALYTKYPLKKGIIRLELTETSIMHDLESHIDTLEGLRLLGAEIQIDDFGTGYSSLAQLAQLPVDALKIDRSFVSKMENDPKSAAVVRTIANLAHSLDLQVIAEGIETESQLESIKFLQCNSAQGYYFSRPVGADAARAWSLARQSTVIPHRVQKQVALTL